MPFRKCGFFFGYLAPPQKLLVFGAGHDVIPLVGAASSLGWETTVADVRSGDTKPDRCPGAFHVAPIPSSGDLGELKYGSGSAVAHV